MVIMGCGLFKFVEIVVVVMNVDYNKFVVWDLNDNVDLK